jgi:hypothetical protein
MQVIIELDGAPTSLHAESPNVTIGEIIRTESIRLVPSIRTTVPPLALIEDTFKKVMFGVNAAAYS